MRALASEVNKGFGLSAQPLEPLPYPRRGHHRLVSSLLLLEPYCIYRDGGADPKESQRNCAKDEVLVLRLFCARGIEVSG